MKSIVILIYLAVSIPISFSEEFTGLYPIDDVYLISLVDNLRIRSDYNINSDILGKLAKYEEVKILARTYSNTYSVDKIRSYWYKIQKSNGIAGWVFGGYTAKPFFRIKDRFLYISYNRYIRDIDIYGSHSYLNDITDNNAIAYPLDGLKDGMAFHMLVLKNEGSPLYNKFIEDGFMTDKKLVGLGNISNIGFSNINPFNKNMLYITVEYFEIGKFLDADHPNDTSFFSRMWLSKNNNSYNVAFNEFIYPDLFEGLIEDRITHEYKGNIIMQRFKGLPKIIKSKDFLSIIEPNLSASEKTTLRKYYNKYPQENCWNYSYAIKSNYDSLLAKGIDEKIIKNILDLKNWYLTREEREAYKSILDLIPESPYVLHENINCPYLPIFTPDETEEARRLLKKAGYSWDEGAVTVYKWNGVSFEYDKYYKSVAEYEKITTLLIE